jgi:hypothetical protein
MMGLESLCRKAKDDNYQISSLISYVGVEYLIDKQYGQKKQGPTCCMSPTNLIT